jgi:periplasmic copper chaperone A
VIAGVRSAWTATIVAALSLTLLSLGMAAQGKRVTASGSWVKLPSARQSQAMAFVAIENPTMYGIYVTSASSDAAGKVELRDGSQAGDARLKPVEFISVAAYETVDMGPNGPHLMLLDLKRPLKEGDRVSLALTTDNAGTIEVSAIVRQE